MPFRLLIEFGRIGLGGMKSKSKDLVSDPIVQENAHAERITAILTQYLAENLKPQQIVLFGSRAKGTAQRGSDIDLAVIGGHQPDFRQERKLREKLDQLAGIYSVDLVFLEQMDITFRKMIHDTGKVLYEKD